ncbi:MAG: hypothetical protein H6733_09260 [Alphaproteobacteria bacterium]|nr:hypothetical protein [Alphaproteobacteria bacterium]
MDSRALLLALVLAIPVVMLAGTWGFVLFTHVRYARYMHHTGRALPRRTTSEWLTVLWREVWALLIVQTWHMTPPWTPRRRTPVGRATGHPVLCVHGFVQNGRNFRGLQQRLQMLGRVSEAVSLGLPPRTMDAYAVVLEARLRAMIADFGGPVDVCCHSMGGIVLRVVLDRDAELANHIGRIVTVATPHQGTGAARGMHLPETRFMSRRSAALAELPHLAQLAPHAAVTTIGSTDDATVYPPETTRDRGAEHVELEGLGHAGVLLYARAIVHILAALDRPQPAVHDDHPLARNELDAL